MSHIISKTIMWIVWLFVALVAALLGHYSSASNPKINNFDRSIDLFVVVLFVIPFLLCGALRFWLWRTRNPWLALVPFLLGLFFAFMTSTFGLFLVPQYCIIYQVFSGLLFSNFLPLFVRFSRGDGIDADEC